jgi:outer membrane lipoprotein SlyB
MMTYIRLSPAVVLTSASLLLAGCGSKDSARNNVNTPPAATSTTPNSSNGTIANTAQPAPAHHSKAKGALLGAAAGAVIGGKKGALFGAAAGAVAQHHRNKVEQQRATGH